MKLFSKALVYGLAAASLSLLSTDSASAQKHGGSGKSGGFAGGSASYSRMPQHSVMPQKSSSQQSQRFSEPANKTLPAHKPFETMTASKKLNNFGDKFSTPAHTAMKNKTEVMGKGFAKGEPNPSAPGGFKLPSTTKYPSSHKDYCWKPGYGKNYCGTGYGCYPKGCYGWGFCGYPSSCYNTCYPNCGFGFPCFGYCGSRYVGGITLGVSYASPVFCDAEVSVPAMVTPQMAEVELPPASELTQTATGATAQNATPAQAATGETLDTVPLVDTSFIASSFVKK
jgi:hypothetical protein